VRGSFSVLSICILETKDRDFLKLSERTIVIKFIFLNYMLPLCIKVLRLNLIKIDYYLTTKD